MSAPVYAGIDFGGTSIRAGALTAHGTAGEVVQIELEQSWGSAAVLARVGEMIDDVLDASGGRLAGVGLAVTGPVDRTTGIVSNPWTLPSLTDVDIRRPFEKRFGVPVAVENDADAAGLGEFFHGAGAGADSLAMVTVGTGIGVSLVGAGNVFRGAHACHQEAGHHAIADHGPRCYCDLVGCWEQLASATALEREAETAIRAGHWTPAREITNARDVATAADDGDPVALELIDDLGFYVGRGLRNIEAFYAPETIVIGGGLGQRLDLLAAGIERGRRPASALSPRAIVVGAVLGAAAGVIGAACAIREQLRV